MWSDCELDCDSVQLIPDLCRREHRWVCAQMCGRETKLNCVLSSRQICWIFQAGGSRLGRRGSQRRAPTFTSPESTNRNESSRSSGRRGSGCFYLAFVSGRGVDSVMQLNQHEMSERVASLPHTAPCDTGQYHSPPQCAAHSEEALFSSPLHLSWCQYSSFGETKHSDLDSSETGRTFTDKLWTRAIMRTFSPLNGRWAASRLLPAAPESRDQETFIVWQHAGLLWWWIWPWRLTSCLSKSSRYLVFTPNPKSNLDWWTD